MKQTIQTKKRMNRQGKNVLTGLIFSGLALVAYQNCSSSSPGVATISNAQTNSLASTTSPPQACTQTCSVDNGVGVQSCGDSSASCSLTQCNFGYIPVDGVCEQETPNAKFVCSSYLPLVLSASGDLVTSTGAAVPAQDPSGTGPCYYYAINNQSIASSSSYLTGTAASYHDQQVASRDHDYSAGSGLNVWHPYTMNHTTVNLSLGGRAQFAIDEHRFHLEHLRAGRYHYRQFLPGGCFPKKHELRGGKLCGKWKHQFLLSSLGNGGLGGCH